LFRTHDFEQVFNLNRVGFPENFLRDLATLAHQLSQELIPTIADLCTCVHMTDRRLQQCDVDMDGSYLADARNHSQHQLLSLSKSAQLEATFGDSIPKLHYGLYETIRVALNIFSLITVYPLPLSAAPFPMLVEALETQLRLQSLEINGQRLPELSLWVSVMGAIAAIGTNRRVAFVNYVTREARWLQLQSWADAKAVLKDYLWYAQVSDFDGYYLWLEVQQTTAKASTLDLEERTNLLSVVSEI
jgi:hypothetical protein